MKKKGFTKRMLSWVMSLVMVCSILAGVTISAPEVVAEAAVSQYTTPITEQAGEGENKPWKILFVLPLSVQYDVTDEGGITRTVLQSTNKLTAQDVTDFKMYIAANFKKALQTYSLGYMDADITVLSVEKLPLAKVDGKELYYPDAAGLEKALEPVDGSMTITHSVYGELKCIDSNWYGPQGYDQVVVCYQPDTLPMYTGFADNERMASSKAGYAYMDIESGLGLTAENKAWLNSGFMVGEDDAKEFVYYAYTEELMHAFLHDLTNWISNVYPAIISRSMPSPDKASTYYNVSAEGYDVMNTFYSDLLRGNVPVKKGSTKTWGMTLDDYSRGPSKYFHMSLQSYSVKNVDDWNEFCIAVALGAQQSSTSKIALSNNINAVGQTICTLPYLKGELNGNGFAITGADFTGNGLIGTIEDGANVKDLILYGASLTNKTAKEPVGLLAGTNYGTIGRCGVTGSITGAEKVGGLVGLNGVIEKTVEAIDEITGEVTTKTETYSGKIVNCFNGATVTAAKKTAGGLAGWTDGAVLDSYNYGFVAGTDTYTVAGATVEKVSDLVKRCYTLTGCAVTDGNDEKVTEKTEAELADDAMLATLEDGAEMIEQFTKGNAFPAIKPEGGSTAYSFMTPGGSSKDLANAATSIDETVWAGGVAVKLAPSIKATKWLGADNKVKTGTVTWVIKNEPTEIEFDETTHKVTTKSDTTIATISKGSIKGKAEGRVYVYAVDTGSMTAEAFVIQVKNAPTAVATYYSADEITSGTVKYTSDTVPEGETIRIYYVGSMGTAKKGDWKILEDEDLTYTLTVPAKYKDYITVTENAGGDYFDVTVKEGAIAKFGTTTKNGKVTVKAFTVSLSLKNDQTNKKTTFKLVASNPVKTITLEKGDDTTTVAMNGNIAEVTLASAKDAAQKAVLKETVEAYNKDVARTDSVKVVRIPHPEQYDYNATGAITLVGKTSAEQNKVSLALDKKTGLFNITAKKGTQDGTEAYFIIWHNSFGRSNGAGYQIVKVTVGEANPVKSLEFKKTEGNDINKQVIIAREGGTLNYVVQMPSAKSAAEAAYLTETITLTNTAEGAVGTDYSTIYKLPCSTEDAFTIAKNGVVTVNGALSAAQKKVSMAAVKGKDGDFKITAAKGTPEGTEAYFLLYHNPEVYSIISVTVGKVNKVAKSELAKDSTDASKAELKTETLDEGKMTVISVPYSTTKQTVILKETKTAKDTENTTITDANKVLRIASADGYEVALNKSTVTAVGALSAAQKKISVAYKKSSTEIINVTVAAKTPVGTETYFIVYHNDETEGSGTGYHIVKVVVTEAAPAEE